MASLACRKMTIGFAWLLMEEMFEFKDASMAGWLYFRPYLASDMRVFAKQVSDYSKLHFNLSVRPDSVNLPFSTALHDAIMLYAHAGTKLMSEGGNLQDGEAVTAAVRNISFIGVGGSVVVLDSQGDRIESYEVMNYVQGADGGMNSVPVGAYSHADQQYRAYERAVVWPGNTTQVLIDYISGGPVMHVASQALLMHLVGYIRGTLGDLGKMSALIGGLGTRTSASATCMLT